VSLTGLNARDVRNAKNGSNSNNIPKRPKDLPMACAINAKPAGLSTAEKDPKRTRTTERLIETRSTNGRGMHMQIKEQIQTICSFNAA
jgi:hypothetical protein